MVKVINKHTGETFDCLGIWYNNKHGFHILAGQTHNCIPDVFIESGDDFYCNVNEEYFTPLCINEDEYICIRFN